jgi:transposase
MIRTRRKFDREFKLKIVDLSYSSQNIKELAIEYDVRPELIYRWRSELAAFEGVSFPGNGNKKMTVEDSEIAQLKKELSDTRMERDILKKAVGIFSKSDGRYFNS